MTPEQAKVVENEIARTKAAMYVPYEIHNGERAKHLKAREEALSAALADHWRLEWIEDNHTGVGGGNGMMYSFWCSKDTECFRDAIDAELTQLERARGEG
jgi:hypothetical protein